jgi:hypothetical protein
MAPVGPFWARLASFCGQTVSYVGSPHQQDWVGGVRDV